MRTDWYAGITEKHYDSALAKAVKAAKTSMNFECHITCHLRDKKTAAEIAAVAGWHTSEIERDPVLGKDSYFYLTKHSTDYVSLFHEMNLIAERLEVGYGVPVVRRKIELIMFDSKKL